MLLLAAAVGSGTKAEHFFSRVSASEHTDLHEFWNSLPASDELDDQEERWQDFLSGAQRHKENVGALPMYILRDYAPVVARFSFRTLNIAVEQNDKKAEVKSA